ncbi:MULTISPECIES: CPBP family intramembrane glutamic endopeptidase [Paenibacillus]|uniref:CPBP family intramembrane metalloprotease domain-containing protein n=1 Tax=Paenibacillus campinasensis TaxID=66347 RepID=A0A268EXW8_9BACL|nr:MULTISPECIES: CPBP family intramembrane glutamic endopeptidase [Paenibacillus]PAD77966.1 CPBP family intramembrane metalloprotease domain-containing protein [Paenibacillus campinasensis]PAK52953.1 CPBP family intramembrane metalloprotease domain-containing protein [Paenibacillus sp. 7541]
MNRIQEPLKLKANFRTLMIPAIVGLVLFLLLQIVLPTAADPELQTSVVITKEEASQAASEFAKDQLGFPVEEATETLVTYQSNSALYGYLTKEKKLDEYNKTYEQQYPYDVFRVRFTLPGLDALLVDVHMQTAAVISYTLDAAHSSYDRIELNTGAVRREMLLLAEGNMTLSEKQALAEPWLQRSGYDPASLELLTQEGEPKLEYADPSKSVLDAQLKLEFTFEDRQLRSYQQAFDVPEQHTAYVEKQTQNALMLTLIGYGLFTLVLGILAIVYSVKTRAHTSFKRGVFLALLLFVIQMLNTYNLMPVFKAQGMSSFGIAFMMIFYVIYSLVFSALLYFSLVGGDGLWRKEDGLNVWPRAKEPGYGPYVLDSMKLGYLWAFILLGIQSIIFIILSLTLNTWATTDSEQSPYNMLYPWLFPLMAWFAGISEEAVYRLFGIKMVKKIVRSTFVASLITSIIWALGHTLYPIYPIISRPIELVIIGLLFSYIFLRYGYLTAMFAHVIFNSTLMGISLILLRDATNVVMGAFYIALPALVAYVIYRFNPQKKEKPYTTTPPEAL